MTKAQPSRPIPVKINEENVVVTTDSRGRLSSLGHLVQHKMYLAHNEPGGVIVLVPAAITPIKVPLRITLPEAP